MNPSTEALMYLTVIVAILLYCAITWNQVKQDKKLDNLETLLEQALKNGSEWKKDLYGSSDPKIIRKKIPPGTQIKTTEGEVGRVKELVDLFRTDPYVRTTIGTKRYSEIEERKPLPDLGNELKKNREEIKALKEALSKNEIGKN